MARARSPCPWLLRLSGPQVELFLIPVVNIEFYPSWFLPVLPCLYSSVLCKNPVTSLYLAGVSPNFPIFFCIKSLMLNLTNYIQIHTPLCRVCLSPTFANSLSTCNQRPVLHRQGPKRVCSTIERHKWKKNSRKDFQKLPQKEKFFYLVYAFTCIILCIQKPVG